MAFKNLTVDYRTIQSIPFAKRQSLADSKLVLDSLTPSERAALFPRAYAEAVGTDIISNSSSSSRLKGNAASDDMSNPTGSGVGSGYINTNDSDNVSGLSSVQKDALAEVGINIDSYKSVPGTGKKGQYRPVYDLKDADLSDDVINTIAGEANPNQESIDGVINNMLNRVGVQKNWNNLKEVARDPGQYTGYRNATPEQAKMIRDRIKAISSGSVPSNIGKATEYRAEYYVYGEGKGKTFEKAAREQGYLQPSKGDNIYAETFKAGPYAPYDEPSAVPTKLMTEEQFKKENPTGDYQKYVLEQLNASQGNARTKEATAKNIQMIGLEQGFKAEEIQGWIDELEKGNPDALKPLAEKLSNENVNVNSGEIGKHIKESQDKVATIRKMPIKDELKDQLEYAASVTNVYVEVTSGGQPKIGSRDKNGNLLPRTGSTRHDEGGAADLQLYVIEDGKKRILSADNAKDQKIMQQFTTAAVKAGATGVGAGDGYMGPTKIHIGGGNPAYWGGADWIDDAWKSGMKEQKNFDLAEWKKQQIPKKEVADSTDLITFSKPENENEAFNGKYDPFGVKKSLEKKAETEKKDFSFNSMISDTTLAENSAYTPTINDNKTNVVPSLVDKTNHKTPISKNEKINASEIVPTMSVPLIPSSEMSSTNDNFSSEMKSMIDSKKDSSQKDNMQSNNMKMTQISRTEAPNIELPTNHPIAPKSYRSAMLASHFAESEDDGFATPSFGHA